MDPSTHRVARRSIRDVLKLLSGVGHRDGTAQRPPRLRSAATVERATSSLYTFSSGPLLSWKLESSAQLLTSFIALSARVVFIRRFVVFSAFAARSAQQVAGQWSMG